MHSWPRSVLLIPQMLPMQSHVRSNSNSLPFCMHSLSDQTKFYHLARAFCLSLLGLGMVIHTLETPSHLK